MNSETRSATLRRSNGATIAYRTIAGKSPGIVFMTGYRSRMEGAKALALEAYARGTGRAFTRFDYQGHGESGGDFESANLSTWIGDALAAAYVECAVDGQVLWGIGIDANIVTASLRAVVSAANRAAAE